MRMVSAGHETATMGYAAQFEGNFSAMLKDVEASLAMIEEKCGAKPRLYYSGTHETNASGRAVTRLKLIHVFCTVDLQCARGTAKDIVQRALQNQIDGSIILMQLTANADEAMQGIIDAFFKEKGISIVRTVDVLSGTA